jgi:hypothetical protein
MKTASRYNKPIECWISQNISDGYGGTYASYSLVFADYASIVPKQEKRGSEQGQLVLTGYFDVSLRFRRDVMISKSTIIKHDNDFYTIQSIVNDRDKEFQLVCVSNDQLQEIFEYNNPYGVQFTYNLPVSLG